MEYAVDGHTQALFHIIDEDERILLDSDENLWFSILYFFPWETIRERGARYYTALSDFNRKQAERRAEGRSVASDMATSVTREEAELNFLFSRDTMKASESQKRILYGQDVAMPDSSQWQCSAAKIAPNCPPRALVGRQPKCFFALYKAFQAYLDKTMMAFHILQRFRN